MSIPPLTPSEYHGKVSRAIAVHRDWRVGQAYYNVLHEVRPDLAKQVDAVAGLDPFYDDSALTAFTAYVLENWGGVEVPQVRFCPESGMLHRLMGDGTWAVLDVVGPADDPDSSCVPLAPVGGAA